LYDGPLFSRLSRVPRPPGQWTTAELQADAAVAKQRFVADRLAALGREKQAYEDWVEEHSQPLRALLAASNDLRNLTGAAIQDRAGLDNLRYAIAPLVSLDDLDTLTDSCFGLWVSQTTDRGQSPTAQAFNAAAAFFAQRIDTTRAPWLAANRAPTQAERDAFIRATAAIRAAGAVQMARRTQSSARQEAAARQAASAAGYTEVSNLPATLTDPINQMQPGTYSSASRRLAATNMDIPIRLRANHGTGLLFLAVEAKVSNSTLNSRKRLIEVARKRERWDASGALYQFRTAAILDGVFSIPRLEEAQQSGVLIFWEHRLADLTAFLQ